MGNTPSGPQDNQSLINEYTKQIDKNASNPGLFRARGKLHYDEGHFQSALRDFTNAIRLEEGRSCGSYGTRSMKTIYFRALTYLALNQTGKAHEDFEYINRKPHNDLTVDERLHLEAIIMFSSKQYTEARRMITQAIQTNPNDVYYAMQGDCNLAQNNYQAAITSYNKAIEHNDTIGLYYYKLGFAHLQQEQAEEAKNKLDEAIRRLDSDEQPTLHDAYFQRAMIHYNDEEYSLALEKFNEAIVALRKSRQTNIELSITYRLYYALSNEKLRRYTQALENINTIYSLIEQKQLNLNNINNNTEIVALRERLRSQHNNSLSSPPHDRQLNSEEEDERENRTQSEPLILVNNPKVDNELWNNLTSSFNNITIPENNLLWEHLSSGSYDEFEATIQSIDDASLRQELNRTANGHGLINYAIYAHIPNKPQFIRSLLQRYDQLGIDYNRLETQTHNPMLVLFAFGTQDLIALFDRNSINWLQAFFISIYYGNQPLQENLYNKIHTDEYHDTIHHNAMSYAVLGQSIASVNFLIDKGIGGSQTDNSFSTPLQWITLLNNTQLLQTFFNKEQQLTDLPIENNERLAIYNAIDNQNNALVQTLIYNSSIKKENETYIGDAATYAISTQNKTMIAFFIENHWVNLFQKYLLDNQDLLPIVFLINQAAPDAALIKSILIQMAIEAQSEMMWDSIKAETHTNHHQTWIDEAKTTFEQRKNKIEAFSTSFILLLKTYKDNEKESKSKKIQLDALSPYEQKAKDTAYNNHINHFGDLLLSSRHIFENIKLLLENSNHIQNSEIEFAREILRVMESSDILPNPKELWYDLRGNWNNEAKFKWKNILNGVIAETLNKHLIHTQLEEKQEEEEEERKENINQEEQNQNPRNNKHDIFIRAFQDAFTPYYYQLILIANNAVERKREEMENQLETVGNYSNLLPNVNFYGLEIKTDFIVSGITDLGRYLYDHCKTAQAKRFKDRYGLSGQVEQSNQQILAGAEAIYQTYSDQIDQVEVEHIREILIDRILKYTIKYMISNPTFTKDPNIRNRPSFLRRCYEYIANRNGAPRTQYEYKELWEVILDGVIYSTKEYGQSEQSIPTITHNHNATVEGLISRCGIMVEDEEGDVNYYIKEGRTDHETYGFRRGTDEQVRQLGFTLLENYTPNENPINRP